MNADIKMIIFSSCLEVVFLSTLVDFLDFSFSKIINNQEQETEANAEFQNTQWTDGMCASLHVVKINDISCFLNEMCFIELVLSKAAALRKMSISLGDECSMSEENVQSKLYTYRRASPSAQVFFKGNYLYFN